MVRTVLVIGLTTGDGKAVRRISTAAAASAGGVVALVAPMRETKRAREMREREILLATPAQFAVGDDWTICKRVPNQCGLRSEPLRTPGCLVVDLSLVTSVDFVSKSGARSLDQKQSRLIEHCPNVPSIIC